LIGKHDVSHLLIGVVALCIACLILVDAKI
jgi:hypothetical protein